MDKIYGIEIYACLKQRGQYNLNGLITLKQVKRKYKCNTKDIIDAVKINGIKKIGNCYSHTTIFDFGITSQDIKDSVLEDNLDVVIPILENLRGITNEDLL